MKSREQYSPQELRQMQLLAKSFPNISAAHTEMINLSAILALPKGTDHYVSDIHGAYDQFDRVLRHASGAVAHKVEETFGMSMAPRRKNLLVCLICYPRTTLRHTLPKLDHPDDWMMETIANLVQVARTTSRKYTRSKIRKRLPASIAYIIEELLAQTRDPHREDYYNTIIHSIIEMGEAESFIVGISETIQRFVIDRLVVLGDVYDRGPEAEKVMERLIDHHEVDMLWGNHDVIWMGAASGSRALAALVTRISLRYGNLPTLEGTYDVSMKPLAKFAAEVYDGPCCPTFDPKAMPTDDYSPDLLARMHKAISIIQFKLEGQIIARHPEYEMEDRQVLTFLDAEKGTITLNGSTYPLLDGFFPTLDPENPHQLTEDEERIITQIVNGFEESRPLKRHIDFMYSHGGMYRVRDGNVFFHGCIPVDEEGEFIEFELDGEKLSGLPLLVAYERLARNARLSRSKSLRQAGRDALWYLWNGKYSPLFGKTRMTTFERYFIEDKETHKEPSIPYYERRLDEDFCKKVLRAFGGDPEKGFILNGHTPVKVKKGEEPVKANGRLIVIDGGMSSAYQSVTGIAGYTLISSSRGVTLATHQEYQSPVEALESGASISPHTKYVTRFGERLIIRNTDVGKNLQGQLEDLGKLVQAFRDGILAER